MIDDKAIKEMFRMEGLEHIEAIEAALLQFEDGKPQKELLSDIARYLHTLKGSGNMAGFTELAEYVHELEDDFSKRVKGKQKLGAIFVSTFLEACDELRSLIGAGTSKTSPYSETENSQEVDDAPQSIQQSLNILNNKPQVLWSIDFKPSANFFQEGQSAAALFDSLAALGNLEVKADLRSLPPLDQLDTERCYLAWTLDFVSSASKDEIEEYFDFVKHNSSIVINTKDTTTTVHDEAKAKQLRALLCHAGKMSFLIPSEGIRSCRPSTGTLRKPIGVSIIDEHQETVFDLASVFELEADESKILVLIHHKEESFCIAVNSFEDFLEGEVQNAQYNVLHSQGIGGFLVDEGGNIHHLLDLDWFLDLHHQVLEKMSAKQKIRR